MQYPCRTQADPGQESNVSAVTLTGEVTSEEPALESCSARLGMARSDGEGCLRTILEKESGGREAMRRPPACTVWYTSGAAELSLIVHRVIFSILNATVPFP